MPEKNVKHYRNSFFPLAALLFVAIPYVWFLIGVVQGEGMDALMVFVGSIEFSFIALCFSIPALFKLREFSPTFKTLTWIAFIMSSLTLLIPLLAGAF